MPGDGRVTVSLRKSIHWLDVAVTGVLANVAAGSATPT
jgi:hypothetical protein